MMKSLITEIGLTSTTGMKQSAYNKVAEKLMEACEAQRESQQPPENGPEGEELEG